MRLGGVRAVDLDQPLHEIHALDHEPTEAQRVGAFPARGRISDTRGMALRQLGQDARDLGMLGVVAVIGGMASLRRQRVQSGMRGGHRTSMTRMAYASHSSCPA